MRRERWAALLGIDDMPAFVSWVHLLPAALEISTWLDEKAGSAESDYLLASQARSLIDKVGRDLQIAGVDIPRRSPADGSESLFAFETASSRILAALGE